MCSGTWICPSAFQLNWTQLNPFVVCTALNVPMFSNVYQYMYSKCQQMYKWQVVKKEEWRWLCQVVISHKNALNMSSINTLSNSHEISCNQHKTRPSFSTPVTLCKQMLVTQRIKMERLGNWNSTNFEVLIYSIGFNDVSIVSYFRSLVWIWIRIAKLTGIAEREYTTFCQSTSVHDQIER